MRKSCYRVGMGVLLFFVAHTKAQEPALGRVEFPTSARSQEAQAHFLRGVTALHSFWYPVALEEFRASTEVEPDFLMGYWGEAMAHNHPIWGDPQNTEAARKVLQHVEDTSMVTPREQDYLRAVQTLYGEGDKPDRDRAYAEAMEEMQQKYPDDLEAASFYALALLGTVRQSALHEASSTRTRMEAAAMALEVSRKQPEHPGATHYVIHAFDDPDHAVLALPAARRYAQIAPAAPHALHMPSHIFLQLGMWPEAAASNENSWEASVDWVEREGLPISQRDYHSLHWLLYIYLQQGRFQAAEKLLLLMSESLSRFPTDDQQRDRLFGAYTRETMAASFIVETEQWDSAEKYLPEAKKKARSSAPSPGDNPMKALSLLTRAPAIFARGLAAVQNGSGDSDTSIVKLKRLHEQFAGRELPFAAIADLVPVLKVHELQISAANHAANGDFEQAVKAIEQALAMEEKIPPPSGPPLTIKPTREMFGEILLRAGRPEEAAKQFESSLFRHPNRARSLLGAARAADRSGDTQGAAGHYRQFAIQWRHSAATKPELREAEEYLRTTKQRQ